ncbi:MAG: DUF1295 domain-containing protein [Ilumatobacteraceae bacterium]
MRESSSSNRSRSFAVIIGLYAVATVLALVVAAQYGTESPTAALVAGFAVSVAFLYIASQIVGNGSTFDAWWSVMPPAFAIWLAVVFDQADEFTSDDQRRWLVAGCAVLWGLRLTANWAIGWPGLHHEDWRYRMLYEKTPMPRWAVSLTSVHLFPLIVVTLGSLPLVSIAASGDRRDLGLWDLLALVAALTGVALEHFADVDLRRFNRTKSPGDVLDQGLWSRSRHPNYLGEMLWWWSLWFFALGADPDSWWTGIGALAMTIMFFTASIPIAEQRSAERRPGWEAYQQRTPMVLPRLRIRR